MSCKGSACTRNVLDEHSALLVLARRNQNKVVARTLAEQQKASNSLPSRRVARWVASRGRQPWEGAKSASVLRPEGYTGWSHACSAHTTVQTWTVTMLWP